MAKSHGAEKSRVKQQDMAISTTAAANQQRATQKLREKKSNSTELRQERIIRVKEASATKGRIMSQTKQQL